MTRLTPKEYAALTPDERTERTLQQTRTAVRRYQAKNRSVLSAKARAKRAEDPEKHREYMRKNRAKDPPRQAAYIRKSRYKRLFKITVGEYDAMEIAQGSRCGICLTPKPGGRGRWHVDHCHKTGRVRMLLCHRCNTGLGHFKDDANVMQRATDYLNKFDQEPVGPE